MKVLNSAGQGEFDNVHIAPKMFVPASAIDWPDFGVAGPPSMRRAYESVKEITMAPFCVHDCLHMHVRWGEWIGTNVFTSDPAFRGWVGDDLPNDDNGSGLPLVPANQKITLKLLPGEDSAPSRDQAPCGYAVYSRSAAESKSSYLANHDASWCGLFAFEQLAW